MEGSNYIQGGEREFHEKWKWKAKREVESYAFAGEKGDLTICWQ